MSSAPSFKLFSPSAVSTVSSVPSPNTPEAQNSISNSHLEQVTRSGRHIKAVNYEECQDYATEEYDSDSSEGNVSRKIPDKRRSNEAKRTKRR